MDIKCSRAAPAESLTRPCYHPAFLMTVPSSLPDVHGAPGPAPTLDFRTFIWSLAHNAAVNFGDVADPSTGAPGHLNLPGARNMIDILALLEEKTRGNLTPQERQLLEDVLSGLRKRYVEAVQAGASGAAGSRIILP